jgi:hypothetical protein
MTQGNQQQGQQSQQQTQQQQNQQGQQQQGQQGQSPEQRLARALTDVRKVQNMMEMNYPDQGNAISMLREAGDLVWSEIKRYQQAQQQSSG